jgi:hypothetical protein
MPLQTRCSKCNLPLETLEARLVGLGDTCRDHALACFTVDRSNMKGAISGDTLFNLLAIFASPELTETRAARAARLGIAAEQTTVLERATLALINCASPDQLTAQTVLDCFSLSRTAKDETAKAIETALSELGYVRFLAMAQGEAQPEVVQFSYQSDQAKPLVLECTTRRKSSELLALLPSALKFSGRLWRFSLRDAPEVFDIVSRYFPLTPLDTAFVRDIRNQAAALPPIEVKRYYKVVEPEDPFMFYSWPLTDENGSYFMSYAESQAFREILLARGCALTKINGEWTWLVPTSQASWLQDELDARLVSKEAKPRATRSASRGSYRR